MTRGSFGLNSLIPPPPKGFDVLAAANGLAAPAEAKGLATGAPVVTGAAVAAATGAWAGGKPGKPPLF